jgi:hypothetical protein
MEPLGPAATEAVQVLHRTSTITHTACFFREGRLIGMIGAASMITVIGLAINLGTSVTALAACIPTAMPKQLRHKATFLGSSTCPALTPMHKRRDLPFCPPAPYTRVCPPDVLAKRTT